MRNSHWRILIVTKAIRRTLQPLNSLRGLTMVRVCLCRLHSTTKSRCDQHLSEMFNVLFSVQFPCRAWHKGVKQYAGKAWGHMDACLWWICHHDQNPRDFKGHTAALSARAHLQNAWFLNTSPIKCLITPSLSLSSAGVFESAACTNLLEFSASGSFPLGQTPELECSGSQMQTGEGSGWSASVGRQTFCASS